MLALLFVSAKVRSVQYRSGLIDSQVEEAMFLSTLGVNIQLVSALLQAFLVYMKGGNPNGGNANGIGNSGNLGRVDGGSDVSSDVDRAFGVPFLSSRSGGGGSSDGAAGGAGADVNQPSWFGRLLGKSTVSVLSKGAGYIVLGLELVNYAAIGLTYVGAVAVCHGIFMV